MNRSTLRSSCLIPLIALLLAAHPALAQNPVQWSGSVSQSVARGNEQLLPLLFWVTGGRDRDNDDLEEAQAQCFRDPAVVDTVRRKFIPVRVSRSSKVVEEAQKLGLPTDHGLYCAVITADGKLLAQMGPGEVADPVAFARKLNLAFSSYCDDLYEREMRPILENPGSSKSQLRQVAQAAWRLNIRKADGALIGLLKREDLTTTERSRLYELLASLATKPCITTLLDHAADADAGKIAAPGQSAADKAAAYKAETTRKDAAAALQKAEPGALEWLMPELPQGQDAPTQRQLVAYRSAAQICRLSVPKANAWWEKATAEERTKELGRVGTAAQTVYDYWKQSQGAAMQ